MDFLYAGISAAVICLIGQIIFANTKLGPVKFFMLVISLGAILSGLGFMNWFNGFGQAGVAIMTVSPGDMFYGSWMVLLTQGSLSVFCILIPLLICCFAAGIICGVLGKLPKNAPQAEPEAKEAAGKAEVV